ncbi:MAG: amino acid ABC transporter permease [Clostridia bacterium]|nr:amino acid ABC transporter permease [Clostridia bacterium]
MELFLEVTLKLLQGFGTTCALFILTLIFALPLGLLISFGTMSKFKPLRTVMKVIVWIVRGIPLMLQVFIVYYVPGFIGITVLIKHRFLSATIAFVLNYACYFSEIFRAGIEAVPRGQTEAGLVLGMTKGQIFTRVTLQQVFKRIIPPMGNEIITLVKDTALARVISVMDIIMEAERFAASSGIIWPLFYTAVFYLIFVGALTLLFGYLEKKQSYYKI